MDWLGAWAPALVMLVAFGLSVLREPRALLPGVLLLLSVQFAALAAIGDAMSAATRWGGELTAAWVLLGLLLVAVLTVSLLGLFLVVNALTMVRKEGPVPAALAALVLGIGVIGYVVLGVIALRASTSDLAIWTLFLGLPLGYLGWLFTAFLGYSLLYGWVAARWGGPVDAVVVLGAGLRDGERVTPLLASRLDRGRRVYERSLAAGREPTIVVSGGRGPDEKVSEAEAMRRHLVAHRVAGHHVRVEDRSTTTEENLEFSAALLHDLGIDGRVAVVTSNYHAFRAATLMRKAGIAGYTVGARTARYFWPSATVREYVALLRDHAVVTVAAVAVLCVPVIMRLGTEAAALVR